MSPLAITIFLVALSGTCGAFPQAESDITPRPRIIGGSNTRQGEFPYQMLILRNGVYACGGALVVARGQQVVLTAAHCVDRGNSSEYTVVGGDLTRWDRSGIEQIRNISRIVRHEQYRRAANFPNDIAVIFLQTPFQVNANVGPIPLPRQGQESTGYAIVTGWGETRSSSYSAPAFANVLQKVRVPFVRDYQCKCAHSRESKDVLPSMICTGGERCKDFCHGDAGGPVQASNGGYLAGIVSWTRERCGSSGYPGVSTKVSNYVNWLNAKVDDFNRQVA